MDTQAFARFLHQRQELNAKLDASRAEMDRLLADNPLPPSMQMLATLEVLLKDRRDLLTQMAAVDDQLMEQLVRYRAARDGEPV
jgi:hypothetical protein